MGGRNLTLAGATLNYSNNAGGSSETLGTLTFAAGQSNIAVATSNNSTLTFITSVGQGVGSAVNYTGTLGTANNKIVTTGYALVGNIIARATVTSGSNFDFATIGANGVANSSPPLFCAPSAMVPTKR